MISGKLSVVKTLQRIVGRGLVESQPKTGRSRRMITLSPSAIQLLQEVRTKQLDRRLLAGSAWQNAGYVFAEADGSPIDADRISTDFPKIVKCAGLPHLTLDGPRHAHATLLLSAGSIQRL